MVACTGLRALGRLWVGYVAREWMAPRDVEGVVHTFNPEKEGTNIEVTSEVVLTRGDRDL
jgi:hypothetical protein